MWPHSMEIFSDFPMELQNVVCSFWDITWFDDQFITKLRYCTTNMEDKIARGLELSLANEEGIFA